MIILKYGLHTDYTTTLTQSSLEFSNSIKALKEKHNLPWDMYLSPSRFLSEAPLDSNDDVPPVPPRRRAGKTMKEEKQSPRPLHDSDIPHSTSALSNRTVAKTNPNIGQYHGNTLPPNTIENKIFGNSSKSSSYTFPGKTNVIVSKPKTSSPILNPKSREDKFERTINRPDSLDSFGNSANRADNTFIDNPFRSSPHLKKEAVGETFLNTSHVSPNQTKHSTDRIHMNRKKPIENLTDDRSVQEIASSFLWYHENLDRCVAKHMLENLSTNGAFLVRNASSSTLPCHVYTLETYYKGKVYKFQISKEDGQFFFNGFPERTFQTLDAMIEAMMTYGMEIQTESEECVHINLTLPWRICMEKKADK